MVKVDIIEESQNYVTETIGRHIQRLLMVLTIIPLTMKESEFVMNSDLVFLLTTLKH